MKKLEREKIVHHLLQQGIKRSAQATFQNQGGSSHRALLGCECCTRCWRWQQFVTVKRATHTGWSEKSPARAAQQLAPLVLELPGLQTTPGWGRSGRSLGCRSLLRWIPWALTISCCQTVVLTLQGLLVLGSSLNVVTCKLSCKTARSSFLVLAQSPAIIYTQHLFHRACTINAIPA